MLKLTMPLQGILTKLPRHPEPRKRASVLFSLGVEVRDLALVEPFVP
jgi:hypothetical protein